MRGEEEGRAWDGRAESLSEEVRADWASDLWEERVVDVGRSVMDKV